MPGIDKFSTRSFCFLRLRLDQHTYKVTNCVSKSFGHPTSSVLAGKIGSSAGPAGLLVPWWDSAGLGVTAALLLGRLLVADTTVSLN